MLTDTELNTFKRTLRERFLAEREVISRLLLGADDQNYVQLAGQVTDLENSALADLLTDVSLADIDRHVEAVRDIDAALLRIADGTFGVCIDCGNAIDRARLDAYTTAKRCHACQTRHENLQRREPHQSRSL